MEANRLRWRCRRGMRELDIVLSRFLDEDFAQLSPAQRAQFATLLDVSDPDLYDWVLQRGAPPPAEFQALIVRLQHHRRPT
jgi:antitoxin CptB